MERVLREVQLFPSTRFRAYRMPLLKAIEKSMGYKSCRWRVLVIGNGLKVMARTIEILVVQASQGRCHGRR
ncbi:MAG TPA: hypothetical protein ENG03_03860 [Thioploca sp.]|nr:hypothetical protein [Thioploca sp.]